MVFFYDHGTRRPPTNIKERECFHAKQRGKCKYCGTRWRKGDGHMDHKMPDSRGGSNTLANKQLLCGPCNTRKGDKSDGEFRRLYRELLLPARQAKGPPSREIKLERFEKISKAIASRKQRARSREDNNWFF